MEAEKAAITIDAAQLPGKIVQLISDLVGMSCGSTDDPITERGDYSPELIVWVPSLEKLELTSWQFISEIMPTSSSELRRDRTQTP